MAISDPDGYRKTPLSTKFLDGARPRIRSELATLLARRGSLGRIVALVINERLANTVFRPIDQLYCLTPLCDGLRYEGHKKERLLIPGSPPFCVRPKVESTGDIVPSLVHQSCIRPGRCCHQQNLGGTDDKSFWSTIDKDVTADKFVEILRDWADLDIRLTEVFKSRIKCSAQYLTDSYAENRPSPTRKSDFITWEQSIIEGNDHPIHKARMPINPSLQPLNGFDFKHVDIAFMAVKRDFLSTHGQLEEELEPLLAAARIDAGISCDRSEMVIPIHEFQIRFVLSLPMAAGQVRLLPQRLTALGQASSRSLTVPSLPGLCIKLSLSVIIGNSIRTIDSADASRAVKCWSSGMLDTSNVMGLRETPIEILPEVACVNALDDHLAVTIRWDPYHHSRPLINRDISYAMAGALNEPAVIGEAPCVAESVFQLNTLPKRLDFLRSYTRMFFRCFLRPLLCNGLFLHAHGQNCLLRFSRSTGELLGFSIRDFSGVRFSRTHFERTTGILIDESMATCDRSVLDLLDRVYVVFFAVHLWPLVIGLGLNHQGPASFTSDELLYDTSAKKEAEDMARGNGWAVVARELHNTLQEYETLPGDDAVSATARELSGAARKMWLATPTWQLQCFISQRMRTDWNRRDKWDKSCTIPVPNIILSS